MYEFMQLSFTVTVNACFAFTRRRHSSLRGLAAVADPGGGGA